MNSYVYNWGCRDKGNFKYNLKVNGVEGRKRVGLRYIWATTFPISCLASNLRTHVQLLHKPMNHEDIYTFVINMYLP